jgi:glycosyltransferase involved in cell wall biosynthesis
LKVLILANTGWYLNNFRQSTIAALNNENLQVLAACPENSGENALSDLPCSVSTFRLDGVGTNLFSEAGSLIEIYNLLRRKKPRLVFSFNPKTNLYGLLACKLLGIACVPNVSGVGNASQLAGWKGVVYRFVSKYAYQSAHHMFFQNNSDCQEFERLGILNVGKYSVIPGSGVDLKKYRPLPKVEHRPFIFLMACRLIREKGVVEYLKAAERLLSEGYDCKFWLAGVPDKSSRAVAEEVIADFADRGIIQFLGNVTEMQSLMENVDCVVLPSWYPEGVPRVLLEGAASGKILISTDRPGCNDIVKDGRNGYFVEPQSVDSLVQVMALVNSLDKNQLNSMGQASRKLAEDDFDEQLVVSQYLEIARKL